jgi:hypothetical protein
MTKIVKLRAEAEPGKAQQELPKFLRGTPPKRKAKGTGFGKEARPWSR